MRQWCAGIVTVCVVVMTGCRGSESAAPSPAPASAPVVAPLSAAGSPESIASDPQPELQMAAGVVRLDMLKGQADHTVKLFGTAGGDPAMNGLYTYIAFYESPAEGWRVFRLGDFLDYTVLSEAPGRVDLELHESVMQESTGDISSRRRRVIVSWTATADTVPTAVVVTPAT